MSDAWWRTADHDRERLLARLRTLLSEHTGLKFPPERWSNIERAVERVGRQQGFADAHAWFEWFLSMPPTLAHLETVVTHLTIGETYFFRDKALFAALQHVLLPGLIEQRRDSSRCLRLWSAGCSTGEEPYSIAILLQRMLPDLPSWHISLLASDINPQSLAKARGGIYDNWSFRGGLPQPHETGFERVGPKTFAVAPPARALVRFMQLNLAEDHYPGAGFDAFDIIFCRNVLMYLDAPRARTVVEKLSAALVEGGWLILAAVESALADGAPLQQVRMGDLILFQKREGLRAVESPPVVLAPVPAPRAQETRRQRLRVAASPATSKPTLTPVPATAAPRVAAAPVASAVAESAATPVAAEVCALIERARCCADNGVLDEAAAYCAMAIAADKLNPEWTDLHASILLEQGATAAAETALKRTLYLDQNRVLTHVKLANLLWAQARRRAEGRRHFRTALELLDAHDEQEPLSDTDGMTVAQLRTSIQTALAHDVAGTYGKSA